MRARRPIRISFVRENLEVLMQCLDCSSHSQAWFVKAALQSEIDKRVKRKRW